MSNSALTKEILLSNRQLYTHDDFLGYVFQNEQLHHYAVSTPNIKSLYSSYEDNCGVFCVILRIDGKVVVFSDPLCQYPVFYYINNEEFVIGSDLLAVKAEIGAKELNDTCVYDYLVIGSPLCQQTLVPGVRRLKPFQLIEVIDGKARIVQRERPKADMDYDAALKRAALRFQSRARATLALGTPTAHLSGGADSRLSVAALASQGYKGPVFSFGDHDSDDRQISAALVEKFGFTEGVIRWFHRPPTTVGSRMAAVKAFNGLKVAGLTNFGPESDYSHMAVTGYFSGGLLKGFGQSAARGKFAGFNSVRRISSFPEFVFDQAAERVIDESDELLDSTGGNRLLTNCLFYLQNRSVGHFGSHSTVANKRYVCVDLIYDPFLLNLIELAPYKPEDIRVGALVIDLIRAVHSTELAAFPYEKRVLPRYAEWCHKVGSPSCFESYDIDRKELSRISVPVSSQQSTIDLYDVSFKRDSSLFSGFFERYPGLRFTRSGTRKSEPQTLDGLLCLLLLYSLDE